MNKNELIYLASPYTHKSKKVMQRRFEKVRKLSAKLLLDGYFVFSPIVYGHTIATKHKLRTDWEYWLEFDEKFVSKCDRVVVYMLSGWKKSKGVKAEIELANKYKITVEYLIVGKI